MKLHISPVPGVLPPLSRLVGRPALDAPPFLLEFEFCTQAQRWQVRGPDPGS